MRDLARQAASARSPEEACAVATAVLSQNSIDLPFALAYRFDRRTREARLTASTGILPGSPAAPSVVKLDAPDSERVWPFSSALQARQPELVSDLNSRFGPLPSGAYQESPRSALLLPLFSASADEPCGVLVAALNPRRALDDDYRLFLELVADQLSSGFAHARAFEEERRRAEALAEIDRAKSSFFNTVSHELRTPLTLILGSLKEALQADTLVVAGEKLKLLWDNAQRLNQVVNILFDVASAEAGRAQVRFVPTDLCALTSDIASAFRSAIEHAGLRFDVECSPLPAPVYVDTDLWEKVVHNLLSNALKYTEHGSVRVSVGCDRDDAVVSVRDTGVGMSEERLKQVFKRSVPAGTSEQSSQQGNGIGLALVQDLVKLHGGSIAVQSRRGEGSTFSVRIPLGAWHLPAELVDMTPAHGTPAHGAAAPSVAAASAFKNVEPSAPPTAPAARDSDGSPASYDTSDARILVVDDNADLRNYLLRLLGRSFKNIESAGDGQTALEVARANPPDIILTDIMMPGLDGLGLIRELRADARTRQVPIILLSARVGEEPTVEGLRAGADDYLTKPFSGRELLARVTVHLRMAAVRRAAAEHRAKEHALRRLLAEKDEFLTIASHEFRTPLTTIGLQADGLLRLLSGPLVPEEVGSRLRRRVEMVRSSCRRLEEIIERLLDVLAMNDGNPFTEVQPVDVAEVARQVVARFQQNRQAGPVLSLTTDGQSIGPYDKRAIEQILSNLLSNAIKFGEGKPVEVFVKSEPSLVRIIVQDSGKGIDPKDQERIFDRFGRAVSRNDYGGFGLGLWMVRRLAEALHGVARVKSSPGMGSTFTIELPRGS